MMLAQYIQGAGETVWPARLKCVVLHLKRPRGASIEFNLLNEENVSGACSGRVISDQKSSASISKDESATKMPLAEGG